MEKITIETIQGNEKIYAVVMGDWAYHRTWMSKGVIADDLWTVTHVPSGIYAIKTIEEESAAKLLCEILSYHPLRWDGKGSVPEEFLITFKPIVEKYR